ncbi:MAG: nickel pincer cofactor biosynthesis protein LarB [Planctomycetes bacterium]|nr:nickel pincer cofactor biosynthesis protein LarB [Planctomycetota bacterium]
MDRMRIEEVLRRVAAGELDVPAALTAFERLPFEDLAFARVDKHRDLRCGFPEVIFCAGKTPEQIGKIAGAILRDNDLLLATRADPEAYAAIRSVAPDAEHHALARCVTVRRREVPAAPGAIAIVCAGTSDLPVAEEARITAEVMGNRVESLADVGVAGIHRLLGEVGRLQRASVIIVVAGMEGALASVVGGVVGVPVIAVPTSVGYGASFGGLAPLLTMLNSCASGVAVVNIDNGFGAGYFAALVNRGAAGARGEEDR